jgi:hypothetical protein
MKKFFLLLLMPALFSCYENERNCADFRTGKFKFEHTVNGKVETTLFERTEDLEIETYNGKTDTSSVRWTNDCEYILKKINPKNMEEQKAVAMKILSTTKDSYTFEFNIVGSATKQKGKVTKLN